MSNPSFSTSTSKRPRTAQSRLKADDELCCFCQKTPAAVSVERPVRRNSKRVVPQPLCLLHYYSTSAVRQDCVSVLDQGQVDQQLPAVQELFAEAFVQLQQNLSEETALSFAAPDPLAIVNDLHRSRNSRRLKPPPKPARARNESNEGGFLRKTQVPDRLLRTRQEQAQLQEQLTRRMNRAAASSKIDLSQRRKPTRKSIWNVVMEEGPQEKKQRLEANDDMVTDFVGKCTCGSSRVQQLSSNTSRNQDMAKGETWGSKDRADTVMTRVQCLECGKVWNEEE